MLHQTWAEDEGEEQASEKDALSRVTGKGKDTQAKTLQKQALNKYIFVHPGRKQVVYLVGQKTKLDRGPRGLGVHTPALQTLGAFSCAFKLDYTCLDWRE